MANKYVALYALYSTKCVHFCGHQEVSKTLVVIVQNRHSLCSHGIYSLLGKEGPYHHMYNMHIYI